MPSASLREIPQNLSGLAIFWAACAPDIVPTLLRWMLALSKCWRHGLRGRNQLPNHAFSPSPSNAPQLRQKNLRLLPKPDSLSFAVPSRLLELGLVTACAVPCCDPSNHQLMTEYFFIGIDGGASSCRARLRDMEGNLLGEGCGGPANIHLDLDLAKESVRAASRAAVRDAGLDEHILHCVHAGLGLAGAGLKSPCEQLCAGLSSSFASTVVATDAYIAWLGAHQGGNGGIVILGTGSSGLAIVDGRRIDVAGWGAEISDEAGGQRMGREALRRNSLDLRRTSPANKSFRSHS